MLVDFKKQFIEEIEKVSHSRSRWEVFGDFCRIAAYTLAMPYYTEKASNILTEIHKRYELEQVEHFDTAFEILVEALETKYQDFFGAVFGEMELGNKHIGQFFTPYHLSLMTAKMNFSKQGMDEALKNKPFITVCEPACGSGGMVIALCQVIAEHDYNPSMQMFVEMTDIDELAFLMSYIQITLYGIPARVIRGDTLKGEVYEEMFTFAYFQEQFQNQLAVVEFRKLVETLKVEDGGVTPQAEIEKRAKEKVMQKEAFEQGVLFL